MKTPIGQAYNKAQTHIYTWWSDGSVTRERLFRANGVIGSGAQEEVVPSPRHNEDDFFALVPVASGDLHLK